MRDGHVVLQFYLGGMSELRLVSEKTYNDGKLHTVQIQRDRQEGSLDIDRAKITGTAQGKLTGLDVKSSDHFVGGVPATFGRQVWKKYEIQWNGFYGCIDLIESAPLRSIEIEKANKSLNIEPGCFIEVRIKNFKFLKNEIEFDFNFRKSDWLHQIV